jgi:hypothetical protein
LDAASFSAAFLILNELNELDGLDEIDRLDEQETLERPPWVDLGLSVRLPGEILTAKILTRQPVLFPYAKTGAPRTLRQR